MTRAVHHVLYRRRRWTAVYRRDNQHATRRRLRVNKVERSFAQNTANRRFGGLFFTGLSLITAVVIFITFDGFQKQVFFITKRAVNTWCGDLHFYQQFSHGGGFITPLPEQAHGPFQNGVAVKGTWPAARFRR